MVTAATSAAMVSLLRGPSSPMRTASMSKPLVLRVRNSCSIAQRRRYRSATAKASAASATGSVVRSRQCTPSPRRRIDLAHVDEVEDDALRQAGPHPNRWPRELDGHETDRHERLAGGAAGLCRQPQPRPSALGESVRPPEQPPAVAEAAVLGGPHQKLRRGRPEREGREDVALAIGDHRDPRRLGPDLRRPPGAVEPAPAKKSLTASHI